MVKIDKAVCLVLDKRYEDWLKICEDAHYMGIDVKPFIVGDESHNLKYDYVDDDNLPPILKESIRYATWHNRPNAYNAWKSHKLIFEQALEDDCETLLLFEDDIEFEPDFKDHLKTILPFLECEKWDMFYFGCYQNGQSEPTKYENIVKVNGAGGFHAVLMKKRVLQSLLCFVPIGPYDWISGQFLHNRYNCYASYPCVISQKSGFSYVEGHDLEKPSRYKI